MHLLSIQDSIIVLTRESSWSCWGGKKPQLSYFPNIGHPIKKKSFLMLNSCRREKKNTAGNPIRPFGWEEKLKQKHSWLTSTISTFLWQHVGERSKQLFLASKLQIIHYCIFWSTTHTHTHTFQDNSGTDKVTKDFWTQVNLYCEFLGVFFFAHHYKAK